MKKVEIKYIIKGSAEIIDPKTMNDDSPTFKYIRVIDHLDSMSDIDIADFLKHKFNIGCKTVSRREIGMSEGVYWNMITKGNHTIKVKKTPQRYGAVYTVIYEKI